MCRCGKRGLCGSVRSFFAIRSGLPCLKVDSPKMRRRRQKLYTHTSSPIPRFPQEHNTAFLLFLGLRVHQYQHFALVDLMAQVQQPSMSADHQRLADLAKFAALMVAPHCLQTHLVKDTLAAALCAFGKLYHALIFALARRRVNCPFGQVFPSGNVLSSGLHSLCPPLLGLKIIWRQRHPDFCSRSIPPS
jgi:hypothetical protein